MRLVRVVLVVLSLLSAPGLTGQGPFDDEKALREIKEVLWPRAYREQDTALLDRLLADEFQVIDGSGGWSTKAEETRWVKENRPGYDSLTFRIKRLDVFENGTAKGRDSSGPCVAEDPSSKVLIRRERCLARRRFARIGLRAQVTPPRATRRPPTGRASPGPCRRTRSRPRIAPRRTRDNRP